MGVLRDAWEAKLETDARAKENRGESAFDQRFALNVSRKSSRNDYASGDSPDSFSVVFTLVIILIAIGGFWYMSHQNTVEREAQLVTAEPRATTFKDNGKIDRAGDLHIWTGGDNGEKCRLNGGFVVDIPPRGEFCTVQMSIEMWNKERGVTPAMIARVRERAKPVDFIFWIVAAFCIAPGVFLFVKKTENRSAKKANRPEKEVNPDIGQSLSKLADFERYVGNMATIKLDIAQGGKELTGRLQGVFDSRLVAIDVAGKLIELPYADIKSAHLRDIAEKIADRAARKPNTEVECTYTETQGSKPKTSWSLILRFTFVTTLFVALACIVVGLPVSAIMRSNGISSIVMTTSSFLGIGLVAAYFNKKDYSDRELKAVNSTALIYAGIILSMNFL